MKEKKRKTVAQFIAAVWMLQVPLSLTSSERSFTFPLCDFFSRLPIYHTRFSNIRGPFVDRSIYRLKIAANEQQCSRSRRIYLPIMWLPRKQERGREKRGKGEKDEMEERGEHRANNNNYNLQGIRLLIKQLKCFRRMRRAPSSKYDRANQIAKAEERPQRDGVCDAINVYVLFLFKFILIFE